MTARDATTAFCGALVDEWVRAGVGDAVVSPGSRSTPLALAMLRDRRVRVNVMLDERSAAYTALGLGVSSGRPAVLLCTSGTAAASFHPAVVEAHHARVPMLVCTADRPPEAHDTGAGQTIDQRGLYGGAVRWYCAPGPPDDVPGAGATWRSIASRSVAEAVGRPPGPVHLNLGFREPLLPTGAALVDAPGRPDGRPWTVSTPAVPSPDLETVERLAALVGGTARGLLVAGWGAAASAETVGRFARAAGWPVLADPISGLRTGANAVSAYEALLRVPDFADGHRPEVVLRIGAPLTGKVATSWLDPSIMQIVVDPDASWLDPHRAASERVECCAEALLTSLAERLDSDRPLDDTEWLDDWLGAEAAARAAIDPLLDAGDAPFEGRVARDVFAALPAGAACFVASSMPVRDAEWFAAPRDGLRMYANRGVNGIDGLVGTALGVALGSGAPTVALLGDLAFLHDTNALLGSFRRGADLVCVVLDNDGGGIFSFLPQAGECTSEEFEQLFGTPHGLDLVTVAESHGVPAVRVTRAGDVVPAVLDAVAAGGVRLIVVPTDRARSVERHRSVWAAVESALSPPTDQGRR